MNEDKKVLTPAGLGTVPMAPAIGPVVGPKEGGGPKGPEPTRYGDWEIKGKCVDF